jgi:pSer/pThr/pTyr-binding forkhead associated (FHA) protein/outer membrane biosynthesis protein TonB
VKKPVFLRLYRNEELIGVKQFSADQVVIGRDGEIDIKLEGDNVSIIHAMIEERDNGYFICDLGSESGTLLNGKSILDQEIQTGDSFTIGDYQIEFYIGIPKPKMKPPTVGAPPPPPRDELDSAYDKGPEAITDKTLEEPVSKPKALPDESVAKAKENEKKILEAEAKIREAEDKAKEAETRAQLAEMKAKQEEERRAREEAEKKAAEAEMKVAEAEKKAKESFEKASELTQRSQEKSEAKKPAGEKSIKQDDDLKSPSGLSLADVDAPKEVKAFSSVKITKTKASSRGTAVIQTPTYRQEHPKRGTFAPPSDVRSLDQVVRPSKGTTVELVVAWKERVLSTHHFVKRGTITVGSHPTNDIVLPVFDSGRVRHPLLAIDTGASVFITPDMKGKVVKGEISSAFKELIDKGKFKRDGSGFRLHLDQGEMIRVDFGSGVSVFVRYVSSAPVPAPAPFFGLNTSEIASLIVGGIFMWIIGMYAAIYVSEPVPEVEEEVPRRATIVYKKRERIKPVEPTPAPTPVIREKVKIADSTMAKVTVMPMPKRPMVKKMAPMTKMAPGKASDAPPTMSKSNKKIPTTAKAGTGEGMKKGGPSGMAKKGSGSSADKKDIGQTGLLGVFGKGGTQATLNKSYEGSGLVAGAAKSKSGTGSEARGAGYKEGSGTKDLGKGGKGTSTYGISGVKSIGQGTGTSGSGSGGLGKKGKATIESGGFDEAVPATIDREAIRRVILAGERQMKNCYEKALNKDPGLYGKLSLAWTITDGGRVKNARVKKSTLNNKEVEQCALRRLRTWTFPEPPPSLEADISYSWVFAAR